MVWNLHRLRAEHKSHHSKRSVSLLRSTQITSLNLHYLCEDDVVCSQRVLSPEVCAAALSTEFQVRLFVSDVHIPVDGCTSASDKLSAVREIHTRAKARPKRLSHSLSTLLSSLRWRWFSLGARGAQRQSSLEIGRERHGSERAKHLQRRDASHFQPATITGVRVCA